MNFRLLAFLVTVIEQSIQALPNSVSVDDVFADAHEQLDPYPSWYCQEIGETEQQNPTHAWLDAQAWTFRAVDASLVFCCEWTIAASLSPSVRIVLLHHSPCYFPTMPRELYFSLTQTLIGRGPPLEVMLGCFGYFTGAVFGKGLHPCLRVPINTQTSPRIPPLQKTTRSLLALRTRYCNTWRFVSRAVVYLILYTIAFLAACWRQRPPRLKSTVPSFCSASSALKAHDAVREFTPVSGMRGTAVMTNDQVNLVRQRPSKVAQKRLLQWHFRLGHVAFSTVVKRGFLGCSATGTDADQRPLCASCQLGKGKRLSSGGMHHPRNHESEGGRQDRVLEPGQVVAMDQYESSLRGHTEQSMGCERESNRYCGGTLFYDGATLKIFVRHQTSSSLTAMETIQSKQMFEREARSEGVMIQSYRSDNSIFTTKEFLVLLVLEQEQAGQGLKLSGVGADHSNGSAENRC